MSDIRAAMKKALHAIELAEKRHPERYRLYAPSLEAAEKWREWFPGTEIVIVCPL